MALSIETFTDWPIYYLSQNLLERLDATTGYIDQMLFSIQGWMTLGAVLLSVIVGFRLMLGFGDFKEALTNLFRIIFLTTLLSSGSYGYTQLIKPAIEGAQQFLAQTLDTDDRAASTPQQDAARKSPYGKIDLMHNKSSSLLDLAWDNFHITKGQSWVKLLLGAICYALSLFAALFLAFVLLGAEVIVKILFIIGPIFIFLFLYQSTRNFTFLWISAVVSNLLLFAITSVLVMMVIAVFNSVTAQGMDDIAIFPMLGGLSLFMLLVIKLAAEMPGLAGSLSGGTAAGASAAGLATAATAALGAGATSMLRSAFSPPSSPHANANGETRKPSRSPMGNLAHLGATTVKKAGSLGADSVKQIQPHRAKINDAGQLVIPMINASGAIQSLEFIGSDGFKKVMTGTKASGAFVPIGFNPDKRPEYILIAEGFATAASLYETTGIPAIHARGKGNLEQVAQIMHRRYPQAQIILAADNDQGKERNIGLETAVQIQERHPELLIMHPGEPGDFNDLALQENGRARMRRQFSDPQAHQYLSESKTMQLLAAGKYDALLNAARTDNLDLTAALAARMMEVPNAVFAREVMKIALNDSSTAVREAAAEHLAKANEGALGANFSDIGIADIQKIQADQTPHGQLAALQTDLDKSGIDLPDSIMLAISSWKQAIAERKEELGLSAEQVARLGTMLEARIIAHQDKKIAMPDQVHQRRNRNKQKEVTNER